MRRNKKYYYIYQITNLTNNKIYIGARSCNKEPIEDIKYWGSSKFVRKDIEKLGEYNFKKDILYVYTTKQEALNKEAELVNKEFVMRIDTYNQMIGGQAFNVLGMVIVKDNEGNNLLIYNDDPRWINGELVSIMKGKISVKDKNGKIYQINKTDEKYLSGELIHIGIGNKGNKNGGNFKDKNHSEDTKKQMSKTHKKNGHQQGDKNSNYGKGRYYHWEKKFGKEIANVKQEEFRNKIKQSHINRQT